MKATISALKKNIFCQSSTFFSAFEQPGEVTSMSAIIAMYVLKGTGVKVCSAAPNVELYLRVSERWAGDFWEDVVRSLTKKRGHSHHKSTISSDVYI